MAHEPAATHPEAEPAPDEEAAAPASAGTSAAGHVAVGILASRITGFLREIATAIFFGVGAHADVLRTALRMPNVLQNLLGEGTISASFIPIYSRMIEEGREEDAGRFAGAVFGLLLAVTSAIVLVAMLAAPYLVAILAAGYVTDAGGDAPRAIVWIATKLGGLDAEAAEVDRYTLSVQAVRIIFPMTGILVLSAWALGVLNSHRRFFLPYVAPVLWNAAIIAALFVGTYLLVGNPFANPEALTTSVRTELLFAAFWGALVGGALQFGVQLPLVLKLLKGFRVRVSTRVEGVPQALRAFGPVVAGRGVAQISSYIDLFLASFLAAGAVSALGYAQTLYLLPVSLFGMSVSASELPELSRLSHDEQHRFVERMGRSIRQILFMTVPTFVGYALFGLLIAGALFEHGEFDASSSWLVYAVLGAYALGLLATTVSRLLQNAFWALDDTRTPAKVAVVRVVISTALAYPLMRLLDGYAVWDTIGLARPVAGEQALFFGAVGLALGASVGAWVEIVLLVRALRGRVAAFRMPAREGLQMVGLALAAALPAAAMWWGLPDWGRIALALPVVGTFGLAYLGLAHLAGRPELAAWTGRLRR